MWARVVLPGQAEKCLFKQSASASWVWLWHIVIHSTRFVYMWLPHIPRPLSRLRVGRELSPPVTEPETLSISGSEWSSSPEVLAGPSCVLGLNITYSLNQSDYFSYSSSTFQLFPAYRNARTRLRNICWWIRIFTAVVSNMSIWRI